MRRPSAHRTAPACVALAALIASVTFAPRGPVRADEPPPLPSLRHLVYSYSAKSTQVVEAFDSGEGHNNVSNGNLGIAPQTGRYVAANDRSGTLTIDVVALTEDGAIVADVRENGGSPIRTSIASDTSVVHDPRRAISDIGESFLRSLSRAFVPETATVGTTWERDRASPAFTQHTHYTLASEGSPSRGTIEMDGTQSTRGARFFDQTEHGTVDYDRRLSIPRAFASATRTLENVGTRRRSTDLSFLVRLQSDSFASR